MDEVRERVCICTDHVCVCRTGQTDAGLHTYTIYNTLLIRRTHRDYVCVCVLKKRLCV